MTITSVFLKGPYQCFYMSLSFVNIGHICYINPTHFSRNGFFHDISCLFTFCPDSINATSSTWKCVALIQKNVCVKILLHTNIRARKAELVRNYFLTFLTLVSTAPTYPLSHLTTFDQINADVSFRSVNYICLATFTCPTVFLPRFNTNGDKWGLKMQSEIYQ